MKKRELWPILLLLLVGTKAAVRRGLSRAQLSTLVSRYGFANAEVAIAVALAESGGNASALGDWGRSFGLWQIHKPAHPEYQWVDLFDPDNNARAAFAISKGGTDWSPWTTFRNGDYRRYLGGES